MQLTSRILVSLLLALGLLALSAGQTLAAVAANTQIVNRATLSYDDGVGTKTATTSVTVTVSLVPAMPVIIPGPDQETAYNGADTTLTNSFIVRANANGPDNYSLATAITGTSNTGITVPDAPTATITSGTTITLGATVILAGSSETILIVPADGTANTPSGIVNGIQAGDTLFINGETRQVDNVTDNATGTSQIVLAALLTNPPPIGGLALEQKTVSVVVTAGTIDTVGNDLTVDKNLTATSTTNTDKTVTSNAIKDTFGSGSASLTKYVRNVTTASGSGTPYAFNSVNYYQTGVQGAPGNLLEYLLVATNTSTAPVSAASLADVLPADFVLLKAAAYGTNQDIKYVDDLGNPSSLTAIADGDVASFDQTSQTLTVNVGTNATDSVGGTIPAGASLHVLYQVNIKP